MLILVADTRLNIPKEMHDWIYNKIQLILTVLLRIHCRQRYYTAIKHS